MLKLNENDINTERYKEVIKDRKKHSQQFTILSLQQIKRK
jgi:hypothetical protein